MPPEATQSLREISQRYLLRRNGGHLITFMCRLSGNLGSSTSWNTQGMFRPVQGSQHLTCFVSLSKQHTSKLIIYIYTHDTRNLRGLEL